MAQTAIVLAAIIFSFGYMQCMANAQPLTNENIQLEPLPVPPAPPEEEQRLDFSGDINATLEEKMLLGPQNSQAAPNGSIEKQKQSKLPISSNASILSEKQIAPPTYHNATFEGKNLTQSSEKNVNGHFYNISIYNYSVNIYNSSNLSGFLADRNGTALYYFKGDLRGNGISSCIGTCLKVWRPFYTPVITVMPGLNQSDFTTFTSANGIKQIAYNGWPLYRYIKDTMPGDAKGQGIDGAWFVIDPRNFPPR